MRHRATVVITTKNRKHDLRKAIVSALAQSAKPEMLVMDDGSTDGTSEMIRTEFPQVLLVRDHVSKGYIVQRNRAAQISSGSIIFSIDDDAAFSSRHTVEQIMPYFDDPRIGAVTIPLVNVVSGHETHQMPPHSNDILLTSSFIGTAHAIRRSLFENLGGYREFFFHQGEEEDLCIRMLNEGYFTCLGDADPIYHYQSPIRDYRRLHIYGPRNLILFTWCNVPARYFLIHIIGTMINAVTFGLRIGKPVEKVYGLLNGCFSSLLMIRERRPVSENTYKVFRHLKKARWESLPAIGSTLFQKRFPTFN
jgi:glycosyltransferase involved in cell wall biosynthesis